MRRVESDGFVRWVATRGGARLSENDLRVIYRLRRPPAYRVVDELLAHEELPHNRLTKALGLRRPA